MPIATNGGELRQSVTFAQRVEMDDGYGNVVGEFVDRFSCRAQITPRLGGETVEAARLEGRQPAVIRVRRSPDTRLIAPDWAVTDQRSGTIYNIRAVTDPEFGSASHGQWIDMLAEAGGAVG